MSTSRPSTDMLTPKRSPEVPVLPKLAATAVAELTPVLRRMAADALAIEDYYRRNGEPFEALSPERVATQLGELRRLNPPPESATIVALVYMLVDAIAGLLIQFEPVGREAQP